MMPWSRTLMLLLVLLVVYGGGKKVEATGASTGLDEASRGQRGSGGTLIIGMSAGNIPYPNTPPNEGFEGRRWVGYQIYDGLANWNLAQGDTVPVPSPALAEKWSVGEDKLTWTIHLHTGVKFHDGTDFNAEAVVFNLNPTATLLEHTLLTQGFMSTSKAVSLISSDRKSVILRGQFWATHSSVAVGLGVALGWHKGVEKKYITYNQWWILPWHRFIDHLAAKKTVESFFETIQ
jgi:Bacterial extracellular solute-binding proteins, family 5 Middle